MVQEMYSGETFCDIFYLNNRIVGRAVGQAFRQQEPFFGSGEGADAENQLVRFS